MSVTVRNTYSDPYYRAMYNRYIFNDPSNVAFSGPKFTAVNAPLTVDSNEYFATQLSSFQNGGMAAYKLGGVNEQGQLMVSALNACAAKTGAPAACGFSLLRK